MKVTYTGSWHECLYAPTSFGLRLMAICRPIMSVPLIQANYSISF